MNLRKILWYEARKDGTRDIKIYAYADGKKKYFSTGFKVKEEEWNSKSGTVKKVHPLCQQINSRVNGLLRKIELHLINGGTLDDFQVKDNDGNYAIGKFLKDLVQEGEEGTLGLKKSTVLDFGRTCRPGVRSKARAKRGYVEQMQPLMVAWPLAERASGGIF